MHLYHTSDRIIQHPDVHYGRKNADFGQGFYLTPDREFTYRWAGRNAVVNEYELDLTGLKVRRFSRDGEWFDYIYNNRRLVDKLGAGSPEANAQDMVAKDVAAVDVVIGPIANDTIFDTMGILSSGYLAPEEALRLLQIGPEYVQVAIKTERAAGALQWKGAVTVEGQDKEAHRQEQDAYLAELAEVMASLDT